MSPGARALMPYVMASTGMDGYAARVAIADVEVFGGGSPWCPVLIRAATIWWDDLKPLRMILDDMIEGEAADGVAELEAMLAVDSLGLA